MNNDPTSGGANGRNTTGNADICQSAGNEGDAGAGLHQHQCGVKVLDFGDGPHISDVDFSDLAKARSRIAVTMARFAETPHEPSPAKILSNG